MQEWARNTCFKGEKRIAGGKTKDKKREKSVTKTDYKKRKSRVWAGSLSLLWSAWQYKGWHQSVEDGQRWERKGLETIWNNRKREREQGSEWGRDFKTEEGKAEAKRRATENLLKYHFTLTQKLWKCFAIFHVKKKRYICISLVSVV